MRLCACAVGRLICGLMLAGSAQGQQGEGSLPLPGFGEEAAWRSHLGLAARFDYFSSDNRLDDRANFFGNTLQARWEGDWRDTLGLRADARATRPQLTQGSGWSAVFNELYASWTHEGTRLRIGQQIVAWGRADFLNPTDNLSPHDYTLLLPGEDDQRGGNPAALLRQALGAGFSVQLYATPYFTPTRVPLPSELAQYVEQRPHSGWKQLQTGFKLDRSGEFVDGSVSGYHGHALTPDLAPIGFSAQGQPIAALRYPAINVFGADAATTLGRYGLRAELAYTDTGDDEGTNPLQRNSYWYAVIGADRSFDDHLNVNLQGFGRHVVAFHDDVQTDDPVIAAAGRYNALLNQQQQRNSWGLSSRVAGSFINDTLRAECLVVWNAGSRSNAYVRPLLSYALSDHVGLSAGAQFYQGDADSYFGALKRNQGWFAELKLTR